jgi:hypothetical protein
MDVFSSGFFAIIFILEDKILKLRKSPFGGILREVSDILGSIL